MWRFMIWTLRSSNLTHPTRECEWKFNRYQTYDLCISPKLQVFSQWQWGRWMDAEVKQRRDKANIYNESPAQGRIPAMLIWPQGACRWVWESVAIWKRDRRSLLPQRHWGYLAELHKDAQSCMCQFYCWYEHCEMQCSLYLKYLITE